MLSTWCTRQGQACIVKTRSQRQLGRSRLCCPGHMVRASRAQFLICEVGRCSLPLRPEQSLCTGQGECRRQVRPHRPPLSHLLEEHRQAWALSSDCSGVVSLTAQELCHLLLESPPLPPSPPPLPNVQSAQIRTALEGQHTA